MADGIDDGGHDDFAALAPKVQALQGLILGQLGAAPTHDSRTISVEADRGAGKTTLLHALHASPDLPSGVLRLPLISPERFAPGDTLLAWVLAELERWLEEHAAEALVPDEDAIVPASDDLLLMLRRFQQDEAAASSRLVHGLEASGLSPEEFGRDAARLTAMGARIESGWAGLVEALATKLGQGDLHLLVLVDDADIVPEHLPGVLRDVAVLNQSRRVSVVVAFDRKTLSTSLLSAAMAHQAIGPAALGERAGVIDPISIREHVERQIVKHFPRPLRVVLPNLSSDHALAFTPVGQEVPLEDVLRRFVWDVPNRESLLDEFVVRSESGAIATPNEMRSVFSTNRRDLAQLYHALSSIDPADPHAIRAAASAIVRHGFDQLDWRLPEQAQGALSLSDDDDALLALRVDNLVNGTVFGFLKHVYEGPPVFSWEVPAGERPDLAPMALDVYDVSADEDFAFGVMARSIDNQYTDLKQADDTRVRLPDQLTSLMWFAWDMQNDETGREPIFNLQHAQGSMSPPGGSWDLGHVELIAQPDPMDRSFWTLPRWSHASEFFSFSESWSRVIDVVPAYSDYRRQPFEIQQLLLSHLEIIMTIQESSAMPDWVAGYTPETHIERVLEIAVDPDILVTRTTAICERLAAYYDAHRQPDLDRQLSFANWYEAFFPLMADRALALQPVSDIIIDSWLAVDVGRLGRSRALYHLEQLSLGLRSRMIAPGLVHVLGRIDPGRAEVVAEQIIALSARQSNERASVLARLRSSGSLPEELLDRFELNGLTPEVAEYLRMMGYSDQGLLALSKLFPVRAAEASGDEP